MVQIIVLSPVPQLHMINIATMCSQWTPLIFFDMKLLTHIYTMCDVCRGENGAMIENQSCGHKSVLCPCCKAQRMHPWNVGAHGGNCYPCNIGCRFEHKLPPGICMYNPANRLCEWCAGSLVPIGHDRKRGKAHDDWSGRRLHKKCWIESKRADR